MKLRYAIVMVAALAGCSKKDKETPAATGNAGPSETKPTETTGTPTTPAKPPEPSPTPSLAGGAAPAPVDVCSFVTPDVVSVIGPVKGEPTKLDASGSLLGGCSYPLETGMASVQARPSREYSMTGNRGEPKDVAGVGQSAKFSAKTGLVVELAGKPYFLHVMVMTTKGLDEEKTVALGKAVAPVAK